MGARPKLDFIRRKWLHVIINDDFLEKGECYERALLPSIICLGRLRIASKYIFTLWQLRQGVDSLAQWLEHWIFNREDRVRFPGKTEYFFSYASFLCYGFHVVRIQIHILNDKQFAKAGHIRFSRTRIKVHLPPKMYLKGLFYTLSGGTRHFLNFAI